MSQGSSNYNADDSSNTNPEHCYNCPFQHKHTTISSPPQHLPTIQPEQYQLNSDDIAELEEINDFANNEESDIMQINDGRLDTNLAEYLDTYYENYESVSDYFDDATNFTLDDINEFISDIERMEDEVMDDSNYSFYESEFTNDEEDIVYLGGENRNTPFVNVYEREIVEIGQRVRTMRFVEDERLRLTLPYCLTKEEVGRLKVRKYNAKVNKQNEECFICFSKFMKKEVVIILICEHLFHKTCIKPWFKKDRRCPLCRQDVVHK